MRWYKSPVGLVETRTCTFEVDPRGFVRATMKRGADFDLAEAQEATRATAQLTGGSAMPVLVDSRGVRSQTKAAREHFVGPEAVKVSSAVAILVGSPVSRMVGNFFLRSNAHQSPTQLFTNEGDAVSWLLAQPRR